MIFVRPAVMLKKVVLYWLKEAVISTLKVEVVKIDDVLNHPNADRLSIAVVKGWNCVVGKDSFKAGDIAVYIPIDAVLPPELEAKLFPPDSKIKLHNSRIKTIKIRGAISQGLLVSVEEVDLEGCLVGEDAAEYLGITKYEPPVKSLPGLFGKPSARKRPENPEFRRYTDIENAKHYPNLFELGEEVVISEKLHGSSERFGWLPFHAYTFWGKLKKFFHISPDYEFVVGSHYRQVSGWSKTYYDENIYTKMAHECKSKHLPFGLIFYGEIVGDGVQKGYTYGCSQSEHKLAIFDIMDTYSTGGPRYLNHAETAYYCNLYGLTHVPVLYRGPWQGMEHAKSLTKGPSVFAPSQPIREGVVIKPVVEQACHAGRKILKLLSDDYLLKDNTDWH
jgi:RNA ligase (TIGR02306 family)